MLHTRFILRQLTTTRSQSLLFVLCVALSIVSLVALRSLGASIHNAMMRDARTLSAADIIAQSSFPFSQPLLDAIAELQKQDEVEVARTYEFFSVVRVADGEETQFVNLKAVDPGYPFYGDVTVASGAIFSQTLQPGSVIAEQAILDRLALSVGDALQVGKARLKIADVLTREPDRPLSFVAFGPRLFVHSADLASLDLVKEGSRVTYKLLLKVKNQTRLTSLTQALNDVADRRLERVQSYETRQNGATFFLNNFINFLSLVAIFTLLMAGIGIQTALTAFLRERNTTIAIVKTLGAKGQFVTRNFLGVVGLLGAIGAVLGVTAGLMLQRILPWLFGNLLPPGVTVITSPTALLESLLLGIVVVLAFTYLPIHGLEGVKPAFIFRKEAVSARRDRWFFATLTLILAFFVGMVLWQLNNLRTGLYFVGGVIGLLLITSLFTWLALWIVRRIRPTSLLLRTAQRGLFRPRNATFAILVTFAAALSVIFCIYLLERDLNAAFVQSYPPDAPNAFFIDIQPDQLQDFQKLIPVKAEYYPVVRGLIESINGQPVKREQEEDRSRERGGDNLARPFNLTYRDHLLESEEMVEGKSLFEEGEGEGGENNIAEGQISILDMLLDVYPFKIGDRIHFNIQGIPIDVTVSSIRRRINEEGIQPFFYFVFPPAILGKAPQTIFTAVHLPAEQIRPLQNKVVATFPNISVIDATQTLRDLAKIVSQLTSAIRFFSLFSVLAGVLIVISSVYATRLSRIQEAAYYKVLGATSRFVLAVFALENLWMGLISALLALGMAHIGVWALCKYLLEIKHQPTILPSLLLVVGTMALILLVGMSASLSILRSRPITYLRSQTGEE